MWIVRVALNRPYTFIVLALLILILSPVMILRTPTDIFPNINIPVVAVAWQFTGMNPEELEGRLTSVYERVLTALVDNVEHFERANHGGCPDHPSPTAAGDSAPTHHQLQRLDCADSAIGHIGAGSIGTAVERPFAEFSPAATRHCSRRGDSLFVWRQTAPGHDRFE